MLTTRPYLNSSRSCAAAPRLLDQWPSGHAWTPRARTGFDSMLRQRRQG
jgi:hypothetical protein